MLGQTQASFLAGLAIGALLLLFGGLTGFLVGRRNRNAAGLGPDIDRNRILKLLKELGTWTSEYRGGVTKYQDELDQISNRAREGGDSPETVLPLVQQIMQSNQRLQQRLDAAERQLEAQTRQIESYLTEARTDGLTGLANRRAFDKKLDQLFAEYIRGGNSFVLALIDIDHFKSINDTHGHPIGDAVLRDIAHRMSVEIEDPILIARFGGEEFSILLPAPLRIAASKMDTFRKLCADNPVNVESSKLKVTVSIGLSEVRNDKVIGPLVRRADEALYAAKGIGRNRTYYHDGNACVLFGAPEVASDQ